MDPTLSAILRTLLEYSQTIDQLRARNAELEQAGQQHVAEIQARMAILEAQSLPPGWRLVKDT